MGPDIDAILRYRRPPDRLTVIQTKLLEDAEGVVIMQHKVKTSKPLRIDGQIVIDDGYDAVWFIYRGQCHDIGIIRDRTGIFTGYYCDVILPLISRDGFYEATDLFLDLWITPSGRAFVLDEDEFEEAISKGWISHATAGIAREELNHMLKGLERGDFPPRGVRERAMRSVGKT